MKLQRIFALPVFAILLSLKGLCQSNPPLTVQEIDGSPRGTNISVIKVTNGTLSISGKTATITISGGGGGSPGGAAGTVQWNDSGAFNGTSGLTATATTITIVNGVTATFSRAGVLYTGTVTTDASSVQTMLLQGDRATVASNDEAYVTYRLSNAAGTQTEVARMTWAIPTATAAAENGRIDWSVMTAGALAKELQLAGDDLSPSTSDGLALGTASLPWSDLFLASGGVIDFANGNVVLTHSSGILTMGTGELRITTTGTNAASVPTVGSTNTFTNKTLTASSNVLGGVTMTLGSDADGDTYYRASGVLTRIPKGTAGQVWTMNAGATAPEWAAAAGGSGITIGTTTVTSGTGTRLIYETSGNVVGEISGATSNGTNVTFGSGNLLATSPVFTTDITTPIVKSAAGADLAANATAPAATTGASQAGKAVSITASAAVASTDTAGAAAGGSVTITAGAAARLTSGNANGGDINLVTGAGIGTGRLGTVLIPSAAGANATILGFIGDTTTGISYRSAGAFSLMSSSGETVRIASGAVTIISSNLQIGAATKGILFNSLDNTGGTFDLTLRRNAAANLAFGAADAASPVAQTLSVQNVVAGTSNTVGVDWTKKASAGTGTGVGGAHVWQVAPAGSSGTTQNSFVEAMRITGAGVIQFPTTITAGGTTGNQTIDKVSGTVNIAAAGTTVTVTNNKVTANSTCFGVLRTNDATAALKNIVPGAGSFVITLTAATTAETSIGFFCINP